MDKKVNKFLIVAMIGCIVSMVLLGLYRQFVGTFEHDILVVFVLYIMFLILYIRKLRKGYFFKLPWSKK